MIICSQYSFKRNLQYWGGVGLCFFAIAWCNYISQPVSLAADSFLPPDVNLQQKGWQIKTLTPAHVTSSKLMLYDLVSKVDWMKAWLKNISERHGDVFMSPDGYVYFYSRGERIDQHEGTLERVTERRTGVDVYRILPGLDHPELFVEGLRDPLPIVFDDVGHPFALDIGWIDSSMCRWLQLVQGAHYGMGTLSRGSGDNKFEIHREAETLYAYQMNYSRNIMSPLTTISFQPIDMIAVPHSDVHGMGPQHFYFMGLYEGKYHLKLYSSIPSGASFDIAEKETIGHFSIPMLLQLGKQPGLMLRGKASEEHGRAPHVSYRLFDPKLEHSPESFRTRTLLETDLKSQGVGTLIRWLDHSDRRVRGMAQASLANRGAAALERLIQRSRNPSPSLGRLHALWSIRMILSWDPSLWKESVYEAWLKTLLEDPSPMVRAVTLDLCQQIDQPSLEQDIIKALRDDDARVRFRAMVMTGNWQIEDSERLVLDWMMQQENQDNVLQHAATLSISDLMSNDELLTLATHSSPKVRMAALLALRRIQDPNVQVFLMDKDPLIMLEAGAAILSESIRPALTALAQMHDTRSQWVSRFHSLDHLFAEIGILEPMLESVYAANAILGQPNHLLAMSEAIETRELKPSIRSKVSKWLIAWLNLKVEEMDSLTSEEGNPSWEMLDAIWLPRAEKWGKAEISLQRRFMLEYIRLRGWKQHAHLVERIFRGFDENHEIRVIAMQTLADWNVSNLSSIIGDALISNSALLRKEAVLIQAKLNPSDQVAEWVTQLESGNLEGRKNALRQIGESRDRRVDSVLLFWLEEALAGRVPRELHATLKQACQQRTPPAIHRKLEEWKGDACE